MRLLLAEDDEKVSGALRSGLKREGFTVTVARTGDAAEKLVSSNAFDIVILDIGLPKRSGLAVLHELRKSNKSLPVLILTARDTVDARVEGLNTGADDYLVKPFAFAELLARIQALLRRTHLPQDALLMAGDLTVDVLSHRVMRQGRELQLTPRELLLLQYLLQHKGEIVSREMIARDVWKETARATPIDNIIEVHITHIRQKVDEPFEKKLVYTIRGVGYVLTEESPS